MFSFFTRGRYTYEYSITKFSKFLYLERRYSEQLSKVKEYYIYRERAVNNNHILNRIITNLSASLNLPDYEYLKIVGTNARFLSKQFHITSNISRGDVIESIFYGKNSKEVLLYTENEIYLEDMSKNWREYQPVRCIYHTDTDLDFYIPEGKKDYITDHISVYEIDIIMLLMQYRYWAKERIAYGNSDNPNVFIPTIVLPNMIKQILNISLFNRYISIAKGEDIPDFRIKHPFQVLDYSKGFDSIYKDSVKYTKNKNIPLEQLLLQVPLINSNAIDVLNIKHKYYTSQSLWVLWVTRIELIANIITIMGEKGKKRNTDLFNVLPTKIKELENRKTIISSNLGADVLYNIEYHINIIKNEIGKR